MLIQYHSEICSRALGDIFGSTALEIIIRANLGQDKIRGQIGHHEYHFDHNAFEKGNAYLQKQREIILQSLSQGESPTQAWQALGRLTHAAQDFYAHTNYVALWVESFPKDKISPASDIEPNLPEFLNHPKLASGRIYFMDFVAFIPGMLEFAKRRVPLDSHTHMNLDHPDQGALFPYAFEAATKRTHHESQQITTQIETELGQKALANFTGL